VEKNMLSFVSFISEAKLSSSGNRAEYHADKYIKPFLAGQPAHKPLSHEIDSDIGNFKAGDKVTMHSHHVDGNGVHHVVVSKKGSNKVAIPIGKIKKVSERKNIGLEQESGLVNHLNGHGLMSGGGAGSTAGNDFHLIDKRGKTAKKISGSEGVTTKESAVTGEHKSNLTAAFGQLTLTRHPKTGRWHISDKARQNRPEYAAAVENAHITVNGKKRKLLDHINNVQGKDYVKPAGRATAEDISSDDHDLSPAHAYMKDHHVDVVHLDSHGTYRAGLSQDKDRHKLGLPALEGTGRFRVRQKDRVNDNARTVQFMIRKLDKSHTHIGTDEGAKKMKKILGH
jgi:hypothetical protein